MRKKIISLILIAAIGSTALISCSKTEPSGGSNKEVSTTEQTSSNDASTNNSKIVGENNKPTMEVKQIATIADFKDKAKDDISKLLGNPTNEDATKSTYEKDNYSFEITYANSKCSEIKIIPKTEMKYPADGANILNLVGIAAGDSDKISPAGLEWDNKFDTAKINVVSNNELNGKISYVDIILTETTK